MRFMIIDGPFAETKELAGGSRVRETPSHGGFVFHVEGPLRVPLDHELRRNVRAMLGRGERSILLNLAGVQDLDAGGIGELVRVYNMASAAHGALRIAHTGSRVRQMLDRVGLFDVLSEPLRVTAESTVS